MTPDYKTRTVEEWKEGRRLWMKSEGDREREISE